MDGLSHLILIIFYQVILIAQYNLIKLLQLHQEQLFLRILVFLKVLHNFQLIIMD